MDRLCLWLDDPACRDESLAGGKAGQLSRLAGFYPVPPGFCLTTLAYEQWAAASHPDEITFPFMLRKVLNTAYAELAQRILTERPAVAVRSSAVDEDSATASFAGQYQSYLNLVSTDTIAEAIQRCWASAHAPQVLAYRRQQGFAPEGIRLAVLVQQLIAADISAVVFSANPVTGNRTEIVINANWGLGESIVGGTVTPDTYIVSRDKLLVVWHQIADKRRMTVPVPGGTREVDVPHFLREQPTLDKAQLMELTHLALNLEQKLGYAVDIECCWQGKQLYLLQCRPITTLKPL